MCVVRKIDKTVFHSIIWMCSLVWIFWCIVYGFPNKFFVNGATDKDFPNKYNSPQSHIAISHPEFVYCNNTGQHQLVRWKKVRKKPYSPKNTSFEENFEPDSTKSEPKNDTGETYLGFPKNPFGSSIMWKQNNRFKGKVNPVDDDSNIMEIRGKRGVTHLYNMVSCATGCNPLSYKGYGCYCGFMGSGEITDGIDKCCKMHDVCYSTVDCPMFLVYFVPYLWRCWRGRPLCALGAPGGGCASRLCECDRQLALCLSRWPCPRRRALCLSSPWRLFQNLIML